MTTEKVVHEINLAREILEMDNSNVKIDKLYPRARQNLIFKDVYLIGKIGRLNVCVLVKGDIEKANDI